MRILLLLMLGCFFAYLFAGCSAIPATQPLVSVPVSLSPMVFRGNAQQLPVIQQYPIDVTEKEQWIRYAGHIESIEGLGLSMGVTNETGDTSDPSPVQLQLFVSDRQDLTAETLNQAAYVMDIALPGGQAELRYDSGMSSLSPAARAILADGTFILYAAGLPGNIHLDTRDVTMQLKLRVSLL